MILGIVSFIGGGGSICCCVVFPVPFLCAIGALITGFLGINKGGKPLAIVGMVLGGLGMLLALGGVGSYFFWNGLNFMMWGF